MKRLDRQLFLSSFSCFAVAATAKGLKSPLVSFETEVIWLLIKEDLYFGFCVGHY